MTVKRKPTVLTLKETQVAIKQIKDFFQVALARQLNLTRVSAPLFVRPESGLNDNLNGIERPVAFDTKECGSNIEIVQSLAKWKRMALYKYGFSEGEGLYTDMNAIRRDEILDSTHSIYVDQWDWEAIINPDNRNLAFLCATVEKIYEVLKATEQMVGHEYSAIKGVLPEQITFITSQDLENLYPQLSPQQRENKIAKDKGAVFIMKIGGELDSGNKHDLRAPDYDDWNLNGDIIFWNPVISSAFEISSMGIRVDRDSLLQQLKASSNLARLSLPYHQMIYNQELPLTIGGGIGQSRLCMFFLKKEHIGEVQSSVWPDQIIKKCQEAGIQLLS